MDRDAVEPVVKRVRVRLEIDAAFRLFTADMGRWWPLQTHSIAADSHQGRVRAERLVFEERAGGRILEVMSDASEGVWGRVLVWSPPERVVFSWKPNLRDGPHTEVEVRFTVVGEETEVVLEHRGWERLADAGVEQRDRYDSGWEPVLARFASAAVAAQR